MMPLIFHIVNNYEFDEMHSFGIEAYLLQDKINEVWTRFGHRHTSLDVSEFLQEEGWHVKTSQPLRYLLQAGQSADIYTDKCLPGFSIAVFLLVRFYSNVGEESGIGNVIKRGQVFLTWLISSVPTGLVALSNLRLHYGWTWDRTFWPISPAEFLFVLSHLSNEIRGHRPLGSGENIERVDNILQNKGEFIGFWPAFKLFDDGLVIGEHSNFVKNIKKI